MIRKTSRHKLTAYILIWDKGYADEHLNGKLHEIRYMTTHQLKGLKRSKSWKKCISCKPMAETEVITKIKIW